MKKFTVSENVEIVADGKRILLEAGDMVVLEEFQNLPVQSPTGRTIYVVCAPERSTYIVWEPKYCVKVIGSDRGGSYLQWALDPRAGSSAGPGWGLRPSYSKEPQYFDTQEEAMELVKKAGAACDAKVFIAKKAGVEGRSEVKEIDFSPNRRGMQYFDSESDAKELSNIWPRSEIKRIDGPVSKTHDEKDGIKSDEDYW